MQHLVLVGLVHDPEFLEQELRCGLPPEYTKPAGYGDIDAQKGLDILKRDSKALRASHNAHKGVRLLSEALRNLSQGTESNLLPSLSLQMGIYFHDGRRYELPGLPVPNIVAKRFWALGSETGFNMFCEVASQTFCLTMESLAASRLTVQKLDIFNGADMQRCSLISTHLNDLETEYPGLRACFAPMKTLSLSLCDPK